VRECGVGAEGGGRRMNVKFSGSCSVTAFGLFASGSTTFGGGLDAIRFLVRTGLLRFNPGLMTSLGFMAAGKELLQSNNEFCLSHTARVIFL
jgi:hypothetical protein